MIGKLQTLVDAGRVPHALVIDGGTFESRLYCAKELAAALLKEDKKVMADIHPDVITVLPEEKKKTLSVEVIRKMREDAYIIPNENERKVYIIGRAELMLDYAQNALLKILEEPPKYATFILLCDTHSALLETVLSRVAVFTLDEEETDGSDETYDESLKLAKDLAAKTAAKDGFALLSAVSAFDKNFDLLNTTISCLSAIIRDALVISAGGEELISGAPDEARALSAAFRPGELLEKQEGLKEIVKAINIYGNKNLTLTRLVSKLSGGTDA
ncbi:MAG: hypothetical protein IIZ22_03455 [Clostridia bacterium]|nr:hypothetical protein [Clostridia bacterium]MBQ3897110.1 hypothetical protein [Clostridia bacterium]